ncbi:hypothetical protein KIN20_011363 [Parelaphostrongylus tenuis]|uniref:MKRN2 opposite strand protein-like C-terminal domain-containing protein n=1 Tax=Parelaphostrongylus tenuis TaxID=148309 RepID=A0AAD5QMF2_PARTN|nr:hypothetical protein KIN20_011363 [Parelaphostrongylus tenuis]
MNYRSYQQPTVLFQFSSWIAEPLPCPFVATGDFACAIIVKPSQGTFLQYRIGDDLHIGISDGSSIVYSYWLNGIRSEETGWDNAAIVCRFTTEKQRFQQALVSFVNRNSNRFLAEFYDESEWNCFDFVLEFLRFIGFRRYSKTDFVSEFVDSTLKIVVNYCMLVRKVQEDGFILF